MPKKDETTGKRTTSAEPKTAAAKKSAAKKAPPAKAAATKSAAKKSPAKKAPAKSAVKKTAAEPKSPAKKSAAKKSAAPSKQRRQSEPRKLPTGPIEDPIGDVTSGEGHHLLIEEEPSAMMEAYRADTANEADQGQPEAEPAPELSEDASQKEEERKLPRPEPHLERLQKILSQAGIASRRHAEEMIVAGRVIVNGETVTHLGSKADPARDHIRVDGKLIHVAERHRTFLLNKPKGYVTTVSDPEGRPTVVQLFEKLRERLYPVGRLDFQSEGLLLMTNDGELANAVTRAASGVEKTYLVKVSGRPTEEQLDQLRRGVDIAREQPGSARVHTAPASIRQIRPGDNPWFEVVLTEGRNRELRKMFQAIGHFVEKIRRVGYGPLVLDVEPGAFRELTQDEVNALKLTAAGKLKPRRPKSSLMLPKEAGVPSEERFDKRARRNPNFRPREDRGGRPQAPRRDFGDRPRFDRPREDRGGRPPAPPREFRPRREEGGKPSAPRRDFVDRPRFDRPREDRGGRSQGPPREFRPRRDEGGRPSAPPREFRPREGSSGAPSFSRFDREKGGRPGTPRRDFGDRPREDRGGRPSGPPREFRPRRDEGGRPSSPRREGGDRPRFDRPREDRGGRPSGPPREFRPRREEGERPSAPRRDFGDRPRFDRPRGDRPQGDRPRFDRQDRGPRQGDAAPRFDRERAGRPDRPRPDFRKQEGGDRPKSFSRAPGRPAGGARFNRGKSQGNRKGSS